MTLGNMRSLGVRSIELTCLACHHSAALDVSAYPDDRTVPSFRGRCTRCGTRGRRVDVRPRWSEMNAPGAWQRG